MLRAIVNQARQGDEEAFGALVRGVGDRCIFIAHRILRDANLAEDAVQVALVQVWRELPALRDLDRFEAWLHRILVNACYAEARRGRHFTADVVLLETDAPAGGDEFLTVHDRDQLDRGFRRLPPSLPRYAQCHERGCPIQTGTLSAVRFEGWPAYDRRHEPLASNAAPDTWNRLETVA